MARACRDVVDRACAHLDETVSSLGPATNDISREGGGYLIPDQRKRGYVDFTLRGLPLSTLPNYFEIFDPLPPLVCKFLQPCLLGLSTMYAFWPTLPAFSV